MKTQYCVMHIIAILVFILPAHVLAAVKVIADVGQPAADFPPGYIYWSVEPNPVIGPSGHIAFAGVADISLGSTSNNTNAVWAGLPGQLRAIIRENEPVEGFPTNVLFDFSAAERDKIVVTLSGAVGFSAIMKGAGGQQSALLIHNHGITSGVLRTGDPAPGFLPGTFIQQIYDFSFSDAGMVIAGMTGGSSPEIAIWLRTQDSIAKLPSPVSDCQYMSLPAVSINQTGEIVLAASLMTITGMPCSPFAGVFKWREGDWEVVLAEESTVPGIMNTEFAIFNAIAPFVPPMTDDSGNITFNAIIRNPAAITQRKSGLWYKETTSSEPRLIVQAQETLPEDPSAIIADLPFAFSTGGITNDGAALVPVTLTSGEKALLVGVPKVSQPYSTLAETGESQLAVIARQNRRPPGFDTTWFYSDFFGRSLNRGGDYTYFAGVTEAASSSELFALWRGHGSQRSRLKMMQGMKITDNGEDRVLQQVFPVNRNADLPTQINTSGKSSQFSDTGDFVVAGQLSGSYLSILLIPDDYREQRIFLLAEQLYPHFFSPASPEDRLYEGYEYRHYPDTDTYIGIKNGEVFVLGTPFGPDILRIGTIDETLAFLESH